MQNNLFLLQTCTEFFCLKVYPRKRQACIHAGFIPLMWQYNFSLSPTDELLDTKKTPDLFSA